MLIQITHLEVGCLILFPQSEAELLKDKILVQYCLALHLHPAPHCNLFKFVGIQWSVANN